MRFLLLSFIFALIFVGAKADESRFDFFMPEKFGMLAFEAEPALSMSIGDELASNLNVKSGWAFFLSESDNPRPVAMNLSHVLDLESLLKTRVIGQDEAVEATVEAILRFAAGISDPTTPIATFLYIGPTGVGKTELAKSLAKELFGTENRMIRFNMEEFANHDSLNRLIGSSFGYVDSEKGGLLTNALLTDPNSVVLLDEIDKAHPEVQKLFLQLFDEGQIYSAMGEAVSGRKAIFILTSNFAAKAILDLRRQGLSGKEILSKIEPSLMEGVSPELYNRVEPVIFYGLCPESLELITLKMLGDLEHRVKSKKNIYLTFDQSLIKHLVKIGYHPGLGARPLKRLIEHDLTTIVAKAILRGEVKSGDKLRLSFEHNQVVVNNSSTSPNKA